MDGRTRRHKALKELPKGLINGARVDIEGTLSVWPNETGTGLPVTAIEALGRIGRRRRRSRLKLEEQANGELRCWRRRRRKPIETSASGELSNATAVSANEQQFDKRHLWICASKPPKSWRPTYIRSCKA